MTMTGDAHVHCFCQRNTGDNPMCCKCGEVDLPATVMTLVEIRQRSFVKLGEAYRELADK